MKIDKYWPLFLLVIPCISGWLGFTGHGFVFKAGVAGSGILFLLIMFKNGLRYKKDVWCIIAAFIFSIIGDWFLSTRHESTLRFVYGILFFFLAHAGYLAYSLLHGRIRWRFTLVILVIYLAFFIFVLYPSIHEITLLIAVLVYLLISCISLGAAFGIRISPIPKWIYFFGITMVLFSDTIIAFREFTRINDWNFLILPTYYMAQISIILSLMIRNINQNQNP